MEAYITWANMEQGTPIEFTGKLVKMVGKYKTITGANQEIWETDQEFDFRNPFGTGKPPIKTNKVTIYKEVK